MSDLLSYWSKTQKDILDRLAQDPDQAINNLHGSSGLIPENDKTVCCIIDRIDNGTTTSDELCKKDNKLEELGKVGKIGVPYLINLKSKDVIAKLSSVGKLQASISSDPPTSISSMIGDAQDADDVVSCIDPIVDLGATLYAGIDEFSNETLIAYILNDASERNNFPKLYVQHYTASLCGDIGLLPVKGINIMEYCDLGTLKNFGLTDQTKEYRSFYRINHNSDTIVARLVKPDHIYEILKQLVVGLDALQEHVNFTSGDLKADNVFVKSEPIDTKYKDIYIKAPFTCKIADYGKSSATYVSKDGKKVIRFYNKSDLADAYLKVNPFSLSVSNDERGINYYTINNTYSAHLYTRMRHMGIPYYQSFDYYIILVSLLSNRQFYYSFFSSSKLKRIFWDNVLFPHDRDTLNLRVFEMMSEGRGESIRDAMGALNGLKLRCDAVDVLIWLLANH